MAHDLRGQRVLVTGASRGIGVHLATALAARGAELILTARDLAKLEQTKAACLAAAAGLGTGAGKIEVVAAALEQASERARLIDVITETGPIDVLINNAGVETPKRLIDQTDEQVHAQLELNLAAPIDLTRRLLPSMLARTLPAGSVRRGTIVNISSMSGKGASPYNSIYAATKYGLNGWTASLRIELLDTGVHVGVVCPGFVAEGMWARSNLPAPMALREVGPAKVVKAMFRVIDGAGEVLVTAGPIKPMLALRELMPSIEAPVLRAMGVLRTLRARAEQQD